MKLSTSLVAVKKIQSTVLRSLFSEDKLELAAQLILGSEGVINPIVVRRTSLKSFEVVDGDFEYYAATRAREIDPRKGEMIGVYIIEPENEENLLKQIQLFREQNFRTSQETEFSSNSLETFLKNLELRFEKITSQLFERVMEKQNLEAQVSELKKQINQNLEPLEVFNNLAIHQITLRLKSAGINENKAAKIAEVVESERCKEEFKSLNDVVHRVKLKRGKRLEKAISSEKMLDIINTWSNLSLS
ncbi:MAG: hypothetical protein QNJ49_19400 [Mastigocoleus sp. MO_167.B18]|nr:hypothetical protein [Mastigocoleus sp. MO_167.B18]